MFASMGEIRRYKDSFQDWSAFYSTDAWDHLRRETLRLQGLRCRACGATDTELHVDHIRPRSLYPHLSLDPDNLQVLCRECNFAKGNRIIDYRHRHVDAPRVPAGWPWSPTWRIAMVVAVLSGIFLVTLN